VISAPRPAQPIDPRSSGTRYAEEWRKTLLAFIPFGALAFFIGWALEGPSGQATTFDMVAYPLMGVVLLALEAVLAFGRKTLTLVVMTIVAGASAFFFCKLGWLLFLAPVGIDPQAQGEFNWWSQRSRLAGILAVLRGLRRVSSSRASCVVGC